MTFDKWWTGLGFVVGDNCYDWAKSGWNAALNEAAKAAEKVQGPYQIGEGTPCNCGEQIAENIRALK